MKNFINQIPSVDFKYIVQFFVSSWVYWQWSLDIFSKRPCLCVWRFPGDLKIFLGAVKKSKTSLSYMYANPLHFMCSTHNFIFVLVRNVLENNTQLFYIVNLDYCLPVNRKEIQAILHSNLVFTQGLENISRVNVVLFLDQKVYVIIDERNLSWTCHASEKNFAVIQIRW